MADKTCRIAKMAISLFFLILLFSNTAHPKIIYVDDDGPADFNNIQAAIEDSIHGDTVIIMSGVYTGSSNRNIDFKGKAITIRSTDPTDPNVVAATVIDPHYSGVGFDFQSGEDENSVIDGITIINGRRIRGYEFYSGGISCTYSSPTIRNCVIRECAGDGIDLRFSDAIIKNCVIRENNRWSDEYTIGAGIVCSDLSPLIRNCVISNNYQGGLLCWRGYPTVINCTFTGNRGVYNPYEKTSFGGSILLHGGDLSVINCTFNGNKADMGGSICNFAMFGSNMNNLAINNCILWENRSNNGPQIALKRHPGSDIPPTVTVSYSDVQGGEEAVYVEPQCTFNWSIGNIDVGPLFIDHGYWDPNVTVEDANDDFWVDGDYHLQSQAGRWDPNSQSWIQDDVNSPCIDAGDPSSDWIGELWPHGKRINIGAYGGTAEASMSLSDAGNVANLNIHEWVDQSDMKLFVGKWLCEEVLLPEDLNRNGFVNFTDFAIFADNWEPPPLPSEASNPNPVDGATDVYTNTDLNWTPGYNAASHDVYFGTANPPPFIANQTAATLDTGTMSANTTYYWRVDEVNSRGKTTGMVWSFTTGSGGGKPPGAPPGCFPADTPVWIDGAQVQFSKVAAGRKVGRFDGTDAVSGFEKPVCLKEIESVLEYQGTDDCYNIVLENGNRINVVHSHYFLTASDRWVLVENLKIGSKLQSLKGSISIKAIAKRETPFTGRFYNLKIKGGDRYFVGKDGVVVRSH